ncbi:hypothetical protein [Rhodococcus rhodochrous]|uniref:hypothetical protein n=1 Tax=Rhodococcus rhodochrous TaxID=1829 RepID=UPI001E2CEE96|nr:hypothetical protein [Rhodococcus rhodochrous]MCD2099375.1 hypothetical protein [Rhodococcus rhodochrous]MCD2123744.1 hypothetical protein [Rhodococcus rhodochrous]MCQ4136351.1 hypothetical protein [Rhodococcus rhodochrous]MDJ0020653.1 hypothetical protein [Rhodococcus rhodochrous]
MDPGEEDELSGRRGRHFSIMTPSRRHDQDHEDIMVAGEGLSVGALLVAVTVITVSVVIDRVRLSTTPRSSPTRGE